jgi:hypothetical protein
LAPEAILGADESAVLFETDSLPERIRADSRCNRLRGAIGEVSPADSAGTETLH